MESTILSGLLIVAPIFLTRYILTSVLNREAVKRASFFPSTQGLEKPAYTVNIATTLLLMVGPFLLKADFNGAAGFCGILLMLAALVLYGISIIHFASPDKDGLSTSGLYAFSRNPMYVAFFIYFLGACILTRSWLLAAVLAIFQVSVHFMILAEERWCLETFGGAYGEYMKKVRRYL